VGVSGLISVGGVEEEAIDPVRRTLASVALDIGAALGGILALRPFRGPIFRVGGFESGYPGFESGFPGFKSGFSGFVLF
jgi:hypothetical protein